MGHVMLLVVLFALGRERERKVLKGGEKEREGGYEERERGGEDKERKWRRK